MSPDLKFSTMVFNTVLTFSFMGVTSLKVKKALFEEPKAPFVVNVDLWDSVYPGPCVAAELI